MSGRTFLPSYEHDLGHSSQMNTGYTACIPENRIVTGLFTILAGTCTEKDTQCASVLEGTPWCLLITSHFPVTDVTASYVNLDVSVRSVLFSSRFKVVHFRTTNWHNVLSFFFPQTHLYVAVRIEFCLFGQHFYVDAQRCGR